jgi:hypothetical protein
MNIKNFYLIPLISLIFILICTGPVQAYYLTLDAPAQVRAGETITVNGSTNTPPPDKIDIVLSHSINIPVEKARTSIEITDKGETKFNATFDTTGFDKGNYKIEALSESKRDFSGGSRSLMVIKLIDRSDLVRITSPTYQDYTGTLLIEAKITDYQDNAIQMEVKKGDEIIFGPESVPVNKKDLNQEIPIKTGGVYTISLTDYDGYIGSYDIHVGEEESVKQPVEVVTTPVSPKPTTSPSANTSEPVSAPMTQAPSAAIENPASLKTAVSRDSPAYLRIVVSGTPVQVRSSENEDWVLEYKTSPDEAALKVNDEIGTAAESFSIDENISEIYVKVYPYSYSKSADVEITAGPASAVELSDDAAKAFNAPPRYNSGTGTSSTPLPFWLVLAGLICALWVIRR